MRVKLRKLLQRRCRFVRGQRRLNFLPAFARAVGHLQDIQLLQSGQGSLQSNNNKNSRILSSGPDYFRFAISPCTLVTRPSTSFTAPQLPIEKHTSTRINNSHPTRSSLLRFLTIGITSPRELVNFLRHSPGITQHTFDKHPKIFLLHAPVATSVASWITRFSSQAAQFLHPQAKHHTIYHNALARLSIHL